MPRIHKNVIVEVSEDPKQYHILSPFVGIYYKPPELGGYLKTDSAAGLLKSLNSLFHLRVPEDVSGFVKHIAVEHIANPVEYRQKLFTLVPGQNVDFEEIRKDGGKSGPLDADADMPAGNFAITSPTEGIFYRKPNPESPPYVSEGAVVSLGEVLGLVEVMKSFNQIRYAGPDFPSRAKVTKILVADSAEVKSGQVLLWLGPVD